MSIPWSSIIAGSTAVFSAAAGGGAWMAARRANNTADAVARIEQDRWHADLLPQFDISIERGQGRDTLSVRLVGPPPLRRLDEICIEIAQSDDMSRIASLPGGPTQDELDAQVWGPMRFTYGSDGADESGKTVAPFALKVGQGRPFAIERTRPPHWQEGNDREAHWRNQWIHSPMRLVLTCQREGFKEWVITRDVSVPGQPRTRWTS
ncbi:hypothetical protein [Streptomyces griseofuscus]|uniref:hypothetical protein n=1 Tax=Streptomyces griseofuscus TaxID=146922 RepID=UPI0033CB3F09